MCFKLFLPTPHSDMVSVNATCISPCTMLLYINPPLWIICPSWLNSAYFPKLRYLTWPEVPEEPHNGWPSYEHDYLKTDSVSHSVQKQKKWDSFSPYWRARRSPSWQIRASQLTWSSALALPLTRHFAPDGMVSKLPELSTQNWLIVLA